MNRSSFNQYLILVGRAVSSFVGAFLLAFIGDVAARVFNLLVGYPWSLEIHQNIQWTVIGLAAGLGAYLSWIKLNQPGWKKWSFLALALIAGVLGSYWGKIYGPGIDTSYYWSRFAIPLAIPLGAAAFAAVSATILRIISEFSIDHLP